MLHASASPVRDRDVYKRQEEALPGWIRWVRSTTDGVNYLAWQIKHYFDDKPFEDIYEYAQLLQRSSAIRPKSL